MLSLCWSKLGFGGFLEANPLLYLASQGAGLSKVGGVVPRKKARGGPPKGQEKPGKAAQTVETGTCKFRVPVSCAFGMHFVVAGWI